jgi:hypothetical protein
MKSWIDYFPCSILSPDRNCFLLAVLLTACTISVSAQGIEQSAGSILRDTVPEPRLVMRQSVAVPGWGQITNQQAWKVPVIYGLFAGVVTYGVYAHRMYNGYKAAYYNSFPDNTDLRFGQTPSFVPAGQPAEVYRFNRNQFRNRRDLTVVGVLLVYGLNVADAYIFAQLRDFDVSDDLSANFEYIPHPYYGNPQPVLTVRLNF